MTKSIIILLAATYVLFAQGSGTNWIIDSGLYYYGTGRAQVENEAKDKALAALTEQIAVRVASSFEKKISENGNDLKENVKSILKTHSTATLKNVKIKEHLTSTGQIEVFCYLAKNEVIKIFNARKKLAGEIIAQAEKAAREGNCATSLKLYYFSSILLNSIPEESIVVDGQNYTLLVPERINNILMNIRIEFDHAQIIDNSEKEVTLNVTYSGRPVALLDFNFWDGSRQVAVQARDGKAAFDLFGASTKFDRLKCMVKYAYYSARKEYPVVADLWDLVMHPVFKSTKLVKFGKTQRPRINQGLISANYNLKLKYGGAGKPPLKNIKKHTWSDSRNLLKYGGAGNPPLKTISRSANRFLNILKSGSIKQIDTQYGKDPFLAEKIKQYIRYNHARPSGRDVKTQLNKTRSGYELRPIRVLQNYPSLKRQTTEYLVLDFNDSGVLQDVNLCINQTLYNRFVKEAQFGKDWGNRQEIIKFIEKYRTAYMTRDIKTVDLMFAEDALILIGRKIKRQTLSPEIQYRKLGKQPDYNYIKLTKQQYIKRQRRVFQSQRDIFLDFDSFNIVKKKQCQKCLWRGNAPKL